LPDRSTELVQVESGKILIINGTSSSGKTTFAKALRPALGEPFCYYASDQLADGGFRSRIESAEEPSERQRFFDGFHLSIAAFAHAGNNLIVEHIVEEQSWADDLGALLRPFDVFWIGLHAPWEELMRRERERKDRTIGEACFHLKTHLYTHYDIEIQSTRPLVESVPEVVQAWNNRFDVRRPPKR
jgi:chloramphenicol 3-O phosphotransferase